MVKPFVILALPRTGTKMVSQALGSHPSIKGIKHEFRGTDDDFWEHPYVLSNYLEPWMLDERITRIHLWREDAIAGAKSLLLMAFQFPDRSFTLPKHEVLKVAKFRKSEDAKFSKSAHYSVSYESLCNNREIHELPEWFVRDFCQWVDIEPMPLEVLGRKPEKMTAENNEELMCLHV